MPSQPWNPVEALFKNYGRILLRKMSFVGLGWLIVYFITQPMRVDPGQTGGVNVLTLFAPMVGAIAGMVAGWYLATDAVEDSSLHGIVLWIILVLGACLPMWLVEGLMHLIIPKWQMNFGGFMAVAAGNILALAAAVWHASSQE